MHDTQEDEHSILVAALVAPIFTPIFAAFSLAAFPSFLTSDGYYWPAFPVVIVVSLLFGYIGMLLVCLPITGILHLLGRSGFWSVCCATGLIGAVAYSWALPEPEGYELNSFLVGLTCSFGVAALFCWIGGLTTLSSRRASGTRPNPRRVAARKEGKGR